MHIDVELLKKKFLGLMNYGKISIQLLNISEGDGLEQKPLNQALYFRKDRSYTGNSALA